MKIERIAIIELVIILVLLIAFGNANKKAKKFEVQLKQIQETGQIEQPSDGEENQDDKGNEKEENNGEDVEEDNGEDTEENGEEGTANNDKKRIEQQQREQEQNKGPITKSIGGTDQKEGLYTQNVRIVTENEKSKLYVDVVNNVGEPVTNKDITICLIDANRKELGDYTNNISSIAPTQIMTLEFDVTNVDKVEGYYLK